MRFSVVMQSYLHPYAGAASNRVEKFTRAVQSVLDQEHQAWELLVVADGCDLTWEQRHRYEADQRIRFLRIPKQRMWSPVPRNCGIVKATGQYVLYLDSDDTFEEDHLVVIAAELSYHEMPPWAAFDDLVWNPGMERWERRLVSDLLARKVAGTSNVVHRRDIAYWPEMPARWPGFGYAMDDRGFVAELTKVAPPVILSAAGYRVHHIPGQYDT